MVVYRPFFNLSSKKMHSRAKGQLRQLGATIRDARKSMRLSQEDFAEKCDLHRTYIGQVERGEKNISYENIQRIASALGISPSQLFERAKL